MNLNLATLPLPPLTQAAATSHRRRGINGHEPGQSAQKRFQIVAEALQVDTPAPSVDAVISAARALVQQFPGARRAPCIRLRLRCLSALHTMAGEPAWPLTPDKQRSIALLGDYAANEDRLIPDAVPVVGGLDEAVLIDLVWPSLRLDLDDYLDFRRLRAEEASLQGRRPHDIAYSREQWLQSRHAEFLWLTHAKRRGCGSYLPGVAPALFSVR
jgi:hypothetical protein